MFHNMCFYFSLSGIYKCIYDWIVRHLGTPFLSFPVASLDAQIPNQVFLSMALDLVLVTVGCALYFSS